MKRIVIGSTLPREWSAAEMRKQFREGVRKALQNYSKSHPKHFSPAARRYKHSDPGKS